MKEITRKNLEELKEGDLIYYSYSFWDSVTRVVMKDGVMRMEENFMRGKNIPLETLLYEGSLLRITKMSLVDLYRLCKEKGWNTGKYISEFGKRK